MRALLAGLLLSLLMCVSSTGSAAAAGDGAPLRLRWELERSLFSADHPEGRSRALLTLTNLDSQPLPAQGWAIYFSAMAGVELGPALEGQVLLERVVATLFRLRPAAGFQPLASGQSLRIALLHPELVLMPDKAPQAPYLVLDEAPARGLPIRDYQLLPPSRPEQTELPPGAALPLATPQSLYQQYQRYAQAAAPVELPALFPTPLHLRRLAGSLHWKAMPELRAAPALAAQAEQLRAWLRPLFPAGQAGRGQPVLRLSLGPVAGQRSPEAYELAIDARQGVRLQGASPAGLARGLQSLRMLLPTAAAVAVVPGVDLPALHVVDAPRYAYRGLMLDVARNFQSKASLLTSLDLMARYKLNTLHLHLSDDEGWRLEIPGLPELTEVGGRRGHIGDAGDVPAHLPPAYGSGPDLTDPYGSGHYSRADYLEILRHAAALQIEVIPEIDMPAHARAAVKAMEARWQRRLRSGAADADQFLLSEPGDRSVYRSAQLYTDHVMNPALPSTYAFVEHVVGALKAMHAEAGMPLRRLHVGGDELPAGAWEQSPACQALLKRLGATRTEALWDHFFERVQALLQRQGMVMAGWEELGTRRQTGALVPSPRWLGQDVRLQVWNDTAGSEDLGHRLAEAGYPVLLSPAPRLYFDMAQQKDPAELGHDWAAFLDLDQVFDFMPTRLPGRQDRMSAAARRRIVGLEATLFSETVRGPERLAYMLMPRLLALAERAWAAEPDWERRPDEQAQARARAVFMQQLGRQLLPRLDAELPELHYRIAPPGLVRQGDRVLALAQLPGMTLRYTSDGSVPRPDSPLVQGPITARGRIAVAAFDRNGRAGRPSFIDNP